MPTAFEKTWQFDLNRLPADNTSVIQLSRSFVWWLKEFLKGNMTDPVTGLKPTAGKWTVLGSSDGVTAALDGTDRWLLAFDGTKIPRAIAGTAHAWIAMQSPVFVTPAGNMSFCMIMDISGTADNTPLNLIFSKAVPTGGSITARPTATDEWVHAANTQLNDNTTGAMHFNGWLATDGNFIFAASKQGSGLSSVGGLFHVLSEARTVDLYPAVSFINYEAASTGAFTAGGNGDFTGNAGWRMRLFDGSAGAAGSTSALALLWSSFTNVSGLNWQAAKTDYSDGFVGDLPIYIANNDTSKASVRGRLADIRFIAGNPAQGTAEPVSGGVTSVILGGLWVPADAALIL